MSILGNFYRITSAEQTAPNKMVAHIRLNAGHPIFRGHFPGNPVTPGVCMLQIVKDIAEIIFEKKLELVSASNVKFMAIINPEINPDIRLELTCTEENQRVKVSQIATFGETVALKLNATYKILFQ